MFFVLCCCCVVALCQGVLGVEHHIKNAGELIEFSKSVNTGTSYNGTTVFLDADIDFSGGLSEQFEPIGIISKSFQGTFDGQGHIISNLAMNSSSRYVGLFGYSSDATIRNVVLDSSCSVVSSCSGYAVVGGITGICDDCTIENTVNMASVAFTGSTSSNLYIGGISGYLTTYNKDITVRNCANYGSVTHSRTAGSVYIGGIAGDSYGYLTNKVFVQNCLNYGTTNHNGVSSGTLYIGGIIGNVKGTNNIENCVSGGKITSNKASNYIGSVVGYADTDTTITHCYWSSDDGYNKACGSGTPTVDTETSQITLITTTVNSLNSYNSSWNKWLLNTNNKIVTFKVNSGNGFCHFLTAHSPSFPC